MQQLNLLFLDTSSGVFSEYVRLRKERCAVIIDLQPNHSAPCFWAKNLYITPNGS